MGRPVRRVLIPGSWATGGNGGALEVIPGQGPKKERSITEHQGAVTGACGASCVLLVSQTGDGTRRPGTEHAIDSLASAVLGVVPEVRVGVESLGRGSMTEPSLHRLDTLAVPDQQARVIVPKGMLPRARRFVQPGRSCRRAPGVADPLPCNRLAAKSEHKPVSLDLVLGEVLAECRDNDPRQRHRSQAGARLRRAE